MLEMPRGKTLTIKPKRKPRMSRKWKRKFSRPMTNMLNKCYCKRFVTKNAISGSDVAPAAGIAYAFSLDEVPGYTDFTNMFDQYQITGIAYRFVINKNDSEGITTAANKGSFVRIMHVVDHNDTSTPTSFAELQQFPYVKEEWLSDSRPVSRWYYQTPSILNTVNSLVANNYNPTFKKWLDTGYPGTRHYGLKVFYDQHYAGRFWQLEMKYYVKLKEIR